MPLDYDFSIVIFHAIQEFLINIIKLALPKKTKQSIKRAHEDTQIMYEDDWIGFDGYILNNQ